MKERKKEQDLFDIFGLPLNIFFSFLIFIFIIAAIFASIFAIISIPFGNYPYFMNPFWHIFGLIIGIIFIILLFKWLFRIRIYTYSNRYSGWNSWRSYRAEEILRRRYARGEITKKQFEEMMEELRKAN